MNCDLFTDRSIQHCKAPLACSPVFVNTEVHSAIWMPSSHVRLYSLGLGGYVTRDSHLWPVPVHTYQH